MPPVFQAGGRGQGRVLYCDICDMPKQRRAPIASQDIFWAGTHCARMDHGGCGLKIGLRQGRIEKVRGDPEGYLNKGSVCPKALTLPERQAHPRRLLHPLQRVGERGGGRWRRISWEEALEAVAEGLNEVKAGYGAQGVAFCQGMPKGLEHFQLIRLANCFGSPNVVAVQDVCHAPREVSGRHTCGFYPVPDYHHPTSLLLLWGSNPACTNEEGAVSSLVAARLREGAGLVVIDPCRTRLAERADLWLQPYPGTDGALALAMLRIIVQESLYDRDFVEHWTSGFAELAEQLRACDPDALAEACGLRPEEIAKAARLYAAASPAVLGWGNPVEQTKNAFATIRALVCLMALCGNLDVPGGNIDATEPGILSLGRFVRADLLPDKRKTMLHASKGAIAGLMTVPPAHFRTAVLEDDPYPVRGAYIQCSNPLLTWADSERTKAALSKLDFLAVSEITLTPTAALADVVLPAATFPEFDDIGHFGLGHGMLFPRPKLADPPGECRSDMSILNALGRRLTREDLWFESEREAIDTILAPAGMDFESFCRRGALTGEQSFRKHEGEGFKTPSGKVELVLSRAESLGVAPIPHWEGPPEAVDADYPLRLTSAKSPVFLHSSYRWVESLRRREPEPAALIHPQTAREYGIVDGGWVEIATSRGGIVQKACLTERILPGVVQAAYGWWFPEEDSALFGWSRSNYNRLTSVQGMGREFGTPNLKGIKCRISPAPQAHQAQDQSPAGPD